MSDVLTPAEIEAKAKAAGLSIGDLCRSAGIALSTFYRWRAGETSPTLDVYQRLRDACEPARADPADQREVA
jgi:predicted transcriptional regulator